MAITNESLLGKKCDKKKLTILSKNDIKAVFLPGKPNVLKGKKYMEIIPELIK